MPFRNALVTGATGFIGSNLVKQLKACSFAERIYGLSRSERGDKFLAENDIVPVRYDLELGQGQRLPEVDVVFHLAGKLSGSLDGMLKVNEHGTRLLLSALSQSEQPDSQPPPVIVGLSSIAAAGPGKKRDNRREADSPQPISDYGRSKLAGERILYSFHKRFPISVIRPGIVFGPGDKEFLRLLQAMHRLRLNPVIGKGDSPLSFVEVSELVRLMMLVADSGERVDALTESGDSLDGHGIYNAASDDFLTLREIGQLFSSTLGRTVLAVPFPKSIGYCLGYMGEIASIVLRNPMTLTRDKIREACAESWRVDSSKATEQLGWQRMLTRESLADWIKQAERSKLL